MGCENLDQDISGGMDGNGTEKRPSLPPILADPAMALDHGGSGGDRVGGDRVGSMQGN